MNVLGESATAALGIPRGCDLDVLEGLSTQCPPVMENAVRKIFDNMTEGFARAMVVRGYYGLGSERIIKYAAKKAMDENAVQRIFDKMTEGFALAMVVTGWDGIGRERIIKYAAKKAMDAKLFDVLLWVTRQTGGRSNSLKEFQIQIAHKLQITLTRKGEDEDDADDDDDGGDDKGTAVDELLAGKIRACLEKKNPLLVHDGAWEIRDLIRIGIPISRRGNYSLVLVASADGKPAYHEVVSIDFEWNLFWDLLWEEAIDISHSLNRVDRGGGGGIHITPDTAMDCILYMMALFPILYMETKGVERNTLLSYWLGEGYLGDSTTADLGAAFKFGNLLLEELQHRRLLLFTEEGARVRSRYTNPNNWGSDGDEFRAWCRARGGTWGLDLDDWESADKVGIYESEFPLSPPKNCPKLSTIISDDKGGISDDFFKYMDNVRVLSLRSNSLPCSILHLRKSLRLLDLHNASLSHIPSLACLENLEILDISNTNTCLPNDFFAGLHNLRLLNLSQSPTLYSLPSSISFLRRLERLLLGGCCNLRDLPSCVLPLEKLQVLDLSKTDIIEFPNAFFERMYQLKDLNLSFTTRLRSLPTSMLKLVNLNKLNLECCTSLMNVNSLSLQNCPNLETINLGTNMNLEILDLSGTKLNKFPLEGNPAVDGLRRLYLFGVHNLHSVNWKVVHWLPVQVKWDQCHGGRIISCMHNIPVMLEWCRTGNEEDGVFISVQSSSVFRSLTSSSPLWTKCLSRFIINISSCIKPDDKGKVLLPPRASSYVNIYIDKLKRPIPHHGRCLELGGGEWFPKAVSGVLSHTNFLYLHDERKDVRFSGMVIKDMNELKQCWLERCHTMKVIFDVSINQLEKLWISNLKKLGDVYISNGVLAADGSFTHLKHLHLEFCPRLVTIFSSGVCLENLEKLTIKFCARLKEICSGESHDPKSFQRLHTLFLLELPSLRSIARNVEFGSLEKAQIKGCPNLRKIPIGRSRNNSNKKASVVVTGEPKWFKQLEWEGNIVMPHICFNNWNLEAIQVSQNIQQRARKCGCSTTLGDIWTSGVKNKMTCMKQKTTEIY